MSNYVPKCQKKCPEMSKNLINVSNCREIFSKCLKNLKKIKKCLKCPECIKNVQKYMSHNKRLKSDLVVSFCGFSCEFSYNIDPRLKNSARDEIRRIMSALRNLLPNDGFVARKFVEFAVFERRIVKNLFSHSIDVFFKIRS